MLFRLKLAFTGGSGIPGVIIIPTLSFDDPANSQYLALVSVGGM